MGAKKVRPETETKIQTLDSLGSPVANVPVTFMKITEGFGYIDILDDTTSTSSQGLTSFGVTSGS